MNLDLIDRISELERIPRRDLIEKDMVMHRMLASLSTEKDFVNNFLFKGGTCLIKCYLGYYRFSEDLDFTWKRQGEFAGKTRGQTIRYLESVLERTGTMLEGITVEQDLDFRWDKGDKKYVELGNGGRITTFHIHYNSMILKKNIDFKMQINFIEDICMKHRNEYLQSLVGTKYTDLKNVFENNDKYFSSIPFELYDIKEILSEKIRALLTRRGIKDRDFLDVYMIFKNLGTGPESMEECITRKINFALKHYERFRNNFTEKKKLIEDGNIFEWRTDNDLLIVDIDKKEFHKFMVKFTRYLQNLVKKFENDPVHTV